MPPSPHATPRRAPVAHRRTALMALTLGAGLWLATPAQAHGPTRQKVTEQIGIDAPAAAVWARIKDFSALAQWHPAVAGSPADKGNEEGSVRQIALKGGGALTETLEGHDEARMRYNYRAKDGGALPVTNYTATITVKPDGDKRCTVEWRGAFYRGFPNNDPPPEQNDEAAVRAVTSVYKSGLENLKKLAEAR